MDKNTLILNAFVKKAGDVHQIHPKILLWPGHVSAPKPVYIMIQVGVF